MLPRKFASLLTAATACASWLTLAGASAAHGAEAIGLNLHNRTAANSAMGTTAPAGAPGVRFDKWNALFGAPVTTVVDSNGRTLPLSVGMTIGSNGGFGGGHATDGDTRMLGTYLDQFNGTPSTVTISSIPYASYDIYVYCRNDEGSANANDRGGSVTVGSTTKYIRTGSATAINTADGSGYLEATDTANNGASTSLGNYVRFTGLSGDSATISAVALNYGAGAQRLKLSGIQIVNTGAHLAAPSAAPAAPSITEIVPGDGSAIVVWTKALDATSFSIRRGTAPAGPFTEIATTDALTTKYTDTGLDNGTTYHYQVAAVNDQGATASASASTLPDDGSSLRAVGVQFRSGGTAIAAATRAGAPGARQANWNSFTGNTLDAMNTLVDNTGATVAGLSFTHTDGNNNWANASAATTNDVALFSGWHDKFDGTSATLSVAGIPFARYDVYFYVRDDTLDRAGAITLGSTTYLVRGIHGNAQGNPDSDGTGYLRSTDTESTVTGGLHDLSTIDPGNYVKFTGVTGGSFTASYTALATSASARRLKISGFQIVDTTPAGSAPATPSGLVATGGDATVALSWNAVPSATSYTVKRSESHTGPFTELATIGATAYTDATAANGAFYYYTVTANNSGGASSEATPVSAAPLAYTPVAIGLDLHGPATTSLPPADLAGAPAVRLPNWNSLPVPSTAGGSVSPAFLVDSAGAAVTGTSLTYTNGSSATAAALAGTSQDARMFGTYADIYGNTPSTTVPHTPAQLAVSGIPYAAYDVYFYIHNDGADRAAAITVNGTTHYIRGGVADPSASGAGYVGASTTEPGPTPDPAAEPPVVSTIPQGNFLRVSGLSGDLAVTLDGHYAGNVSARLKLGGVQIVNASAPVPPTAVPAAPAGLVVTGGVQQNTLVWSPVNGATGYLVQRADSASGPYATIATLSAFSTSYTDTGLADNVTHHYRVVATNSVGESAASATAAGTTALAPVTGLATLAGDGQVTLTWTGTASATAYEVRFRDASGSFPATASQTVTGTTATVTGLTNGAAYHFVVRAVAGALSSADSAEALGVPVRPAVIRSIGLNFTNPAAAMAPGDASGVSLYRQGNWNNYQVTAPSTVTVLGPVAGAYVDNTGVSVSGFTTEFTSSASNTVNRGTSGDRLFHSNFDQSNTGASNIILFGVPYARYDLLVYVYDDTALRAGRLTVNDTNTVITYYIRGLGATEASTNPGNNGAPYVLAHQTTLPEAGGSAAAQGNYVHIVGLTSPAVQVEFAAIAAGDATQRIKIAGIQVVNTSESTALPAAATGLSALASSGQVALSWTAAPGVTSYHVRRSTVAGGPYVTVAADVSGTAYTDTTVTNGTTYHYVVTSVSATAGTDSAPVAATPSLPAPPAPAALSATAGDASVTLAWTGSAGATSYTIRRATVSGGPYTDLSVGAVVSTTYTDTTAQNGTTYHYVVAAVGAEGGVSADSNEASATPVAGDLLAAWRQTHFGVTENEGDAADTADPDADGVANLLEYATGTDPRIAGVPAVTVGRSGNVLTLTYTRVADPALAYTVEASNDLAAWTTLAAAGNPSTGAANQAGPVTVTDTVSLLTQPRRFLRLKVGY